MSKAQSRITELVAMNNLEVTAGSMILVPETAPMRQQPDYSTGRQARPAHILILTTHFIPVQIGNMNAPPVDQSKTLTMARTTDRKRPSQEKLLTI